ncbi:MAG: hypothetical protein FWF69_06645 [Firmicutes bacterium]|nr:hypothetical protein [Bacillota bacterium]
MRQLRWKFFAGFVAAILLLVGAAQAWNDDLMRKLEALGPQDYAPMFDMAPQTDGAYSTMLATKLGESFVFDGEAFLRALLTYDEATRSVVVMLLAGGILDAYTNGYADLSENMEDALARQREQAEARVKIIREIEESVLVQKKRMGLTE